MPNTPTQRTTRSGSNTSSISLNDMKSLLDNMKNDISTVVKEKNDNLESLIVSLNKRLDNLEKQNSTLLAKCQALEEKCKTYDKRIEKGDAASQEDVTREVMERHRRRQYVIVSGIQESTRGSIEERKKADKEKVQNLASKIGISLDLPDDVTRIGRVNSTTARLLRVKC